MWNLLQLIFIGHAHKWKVKEKGKLLGEGKVPIGFYYIQECEHCGIVKRRDLD